VNDIDEVTKEFIVESLECVEQLDQAFVALEQSPHDAEILTKIFRGVHTVKGTSGCLGFPLLEGVTHAGENLLARMREGTLPVTERRVSLLLRVVDAMRSMLSAIETTGADDDHVDYTELLDGLVLAVEPEVEGDVGAAAAPPAEVDPIAGFELFDAAPAPEAVAAVAAPSPAAAAPEARVPVDS